MQSGRRLDLLVVQVVEVVAHAEQGPHHRARRRADDGVGTRHVDPAVAQSLEEADLPGDAGDAATAEHQAGFRTHK